MSNKMNLRVILIAAGTGPIETLLISDKIRVVKTYALGNHMGCVVEVNHKGKRSSVRVCPDVAYADDNASFVMLKQQEDGEWGKYYDIDADVDFMYARFPKSYQWMYDKKHAKPKRPPVINHMPMLMKVSEVTSRIFNPNKIVLRARKRSANA